MVGDIGVKIRHGRAVRKKLSGKRRRDERKGRREKRAVVSLARGRIEVPEVYSALSGPSERWSSKGVPAQSLQSGAMITSHWGR